jgi:uncharacterized surface protein with fasciclin (FAS1) repeats
MIRIPIHSPSDTRIAAIRLGSLEILRTFALRMVMVGFAFIVLTGVARAQSVSQDQDAWSVIQSNPEFSDAVALFKYAGLVQYVQTDRFTAFIPTNAAFDSHPGVLSGLLKERTRAFPDITSAVAFIRSHAVYDLHPLSEFSGTTATLTSIAGNPIHIDGTVPGKYTVTWTSVQSDVATATIVDKPIIASNAIIYPVDTVVLMSP